MRYQSTVAVVSAVLALAGLASSVLATDVTERVSVGTGGVELSVGIDSASMSGDGRYVVFETTAPQLPGANTISQVYMHDRVTGETKLISGAFGSLEIGGNDDSFTPRISRDGNFVVFQSFASNFGTGDTPSACDVFVYDRQNQTLELVSRASDGTPGDQDSYDSLQVGISGDGRFVAFTSRAANLAADGGGSFGQIYLRDRFNGTTVRVSSNVNGVQGASFSSYPSVSDDGDKVAFRSFSNSLVTGDTNSAIDIFVKTVSTGAIVRANLNNNGAQLTNGLHSEPQISPNGRYVLFTSTSTSLVSGISTANPGEVYIRDLSAGVTTRVSRPTNPAVRVNGACAAGTFSAIQPDGSFYVAFSSSASNLIAGDTNALSDIYRVRFTSSSPITLAIDAASMTRMSVTNDGAQATGGDSFYPTLSSDGQSVCFETGATNLIAGDTNNAVDAYVRGALLVTAPACLADVASDSADVARNPSGAVGPEDLEAFVNGFIAENAAIADVASDSSDTTFNPNGTVGPEDLEAFVNAFIAGC